LPTTRPNSSGVLTSLTKPAARCKMQELVLRLQGHDLYNLSPGLYALPRRAFRAASLTLSRSSSEERLLVETWCAPSGVFLRQMLPSR
jgi:hypothetical protein